MFEKPNPNQNPSVNSASQPTSSAMPPAFPPSVIAPEGTPAEFIYQGQRFYIHSILSQWRESGGWWNRINDGVMRSESALENFIFDDGGRSLWRVEAAPIGMVRTFDIEFDEVTKLWRVIPTSRKI
jgi:hypothetical protein